MNIIFFQQYGKPRIKLYFDEVNKEDNKLTLHAFAFSDNK